MIGLLKQTEWWMYPPLFIFFNLEKAINWIFEEQEYKKRGERLIFVILSFIANSVYICIFLLLSSRGN